MSAKEEKKVQSTIMLNLGKHPNFRVWRNQVGTGYGMYIVRNALGMIKAGKIKMAIQTLVQAQPIKYGIKGQSDIFGIHCSGRFISIEVKAPGKLNQESEEQVRWGTMVMKYGGFYRCVDNWEILKEELTNLGMFDDND